MSLTFKLFSLGIRTLAKPVGNYIKKQAKDHEGFRRLAINQAQRVHRIDMRMRLGILHDTAAQERMHERERKAAERRRKEADGVPTVKTEDEQRKADEKADLEDAAQEADDKKKDVRPRIRPLSDARAIELGANFFSEAFVFGVAVGLLLLENWRSRRSASNRRDEIHDRLDALEAEVERLKGQHDDLPELVIESSRASRQRYGWYNPVGWWKRAQGSGDSEDDEDEESQDDKKNEAQSRLQTSSTDQEATIPGNVPHPSPSQAVKVVKQRIAAPEGLLEATNEQKKGGKGEKDG